MAVATVGVVCVVTVAIGLVSGRSVHATAHPGASAAHAAGSIRRFDSNGPGARKVSPGEMSAWSVLMKRLSHGDVRKPRDASDCEDAVPGSDCYDNVTWAKSAGILAHSEWYPGLSASSSRRDFQELLFKSGVRGACKMPCAEAREDHSGLQQRGVAHSPTPPPPTPPTTAPPPPSRTCDFAYSGGPADMCFCELAKNRGCAGVPCACPQGCGAGVTWDHPSSVTFVNKAQAQGCAVQKALLTIPKSYYIDMKFLRTWCPWKMELLLREMFEFGLITYNQHVAPGPVQHCIHAANHVSISWLHLHTFCHDGTVDGMPMRPTTPPFLAWCATMQAPGESVELAKQAVAWAVRLYGPLFGRAPRNCAEMGCNQPGPADFCSCNAECTRYDDCCSDFHAVCKPT